MTAPRRCAISRTSVSVLMADFGVAVAVLPTLKLLHRRNHFEGTIIACVINITHAASHRLAG
jgi:hypothetical protein